MNLLPQLFVQLIFVGESGAGCWSHAENLRAKVKSAVTLPEYPQCRAKVKVSTVERNENVQVCHYESSLRCEIETDSGLTPIWSWSAAPLLIRDSRTCCSFEPVLFTDSIEPTRKTCVIYSSLRGFIVVSYYGLLSMLKIRIRFGYIKKELVQDKHFRKHIAIREISSFIPRKWFHLAKMYEPKINTLLHFWELCTFNLEIKMNSIWLIVDKIKTIFRSFLISYEIFK